MPKDCPRRPAVYCSPTPSFRIRHCTPTNNVQDWCSGGFKGELKDLTCFQQRPLYVSFWVFNGHPPLLSGNCFTHTHPLKIFWIRPSDELFYCGWVKLALNAYYRCIDFDRTCIYMYGLRFWAYEGIIIVYISFYIVFKMVPKERVRAVASAMQADLQKERKALTKLREVTGMLLFACMRNNSILLQLVNIIYRSFKAYLSKLFQR